MGFSGGGSNILLPHTHDGRISQDGGPLQFNNVTQSQSAAGEVFYSDGTALQQLVYPAVPAGETLTAVAASTAPSWAAGAAGSVFELVSTTELGVDANDITSTFVPILQSDISYLHCIVNGNTSATGSSIALRVNSITTSTYEFSQVGYSGGISVNSKTGYPFHQLLDGSGQPFVSTFDVSCNPTTSTINIQGFTSMSDTSLATVFFTTGGSNSTAAQTSLSEIKVFMWNGAHNLLAGTKMDIYKVLI